MSTKARTRKPLDPTALVAAEKYIRLGKDGKFWVEIDRRRPDGTPFRKASKYTTIEKAIRARDAWIKMLEADLSPQILTLDKWATECFDKIMPFPHNRKKGLKSNTINGYRRDYSNHVSPKIGRMELARVKPEHLMKILHEDMSNRDSDTQANVRTVVSKLYTLAQVFQKVPLGHNPVKLVTVPRTGAKHDDDGWEISSVRNLNSSEQTKLLNAAATFQWRFCPRDEIYTGEEGRSWLWLALLIGLKMGLRRGEILGFNLRAVNWERGLYDVRWQVNRIYGGTPPVQALDSLKKEGSYRTMPIPGSVMAELRKIRERLPNAVHIFDNPDGTHRDPEDLNIMFKIAAREAGLLNCRDDRGAPLKDATPHDMRHTFGHMHANILKTPHTALQKLMGHKNIQTTLSYYAVVSTDDVVEAMRAVS